MQNNVVAVLQSPDCHTQLLRLVKKVEEGDTTLLGRTIGELRTIIDGEYAPEVHTQALRLLKELFLLGREEIIKRIEQELLPRLVRVIEGTTNPQMYFLERSTNQRIGDERQREQLRKGGSDYINYCLESIRTWAEWVKFTPEGYRSIFTDRAEQLLAAGWKFPSERSLYKQVDREKFQRVYKMEFFNSESEFEDSVLNEANIEQLVAREMNQCEQIVQGLRHQLKATEQQTNWKQVKQLLERAGMFFHEESVKLIQELRGVSGQSDNLAKLLEKQSDFGTLVEDYEFYRAGRMTYQQFYRTYGQIEKQKPFQKPQESFRTYDANKREQAFSIDNIPNSVQFEPMTVDINHSIKASMKKRVLNNPTEPHMLTDNRELTTQQEPIRHEYKLQLDQIKSEYEQKLVTEREQANRRVDEVKRMINANSTELKEEWMKRLESENEQFRKRYQQLLHQIKEKEDENDQLNRQLKASQQQYRQKIEEMEERQESFRRTADELGRLKRLSNQQEQTLAMLRVQSNGKEQRQRESLPQSQRESDAGSLTSKKFEKRLDNLQQEVLILREQLEVERKKQYREGDIELQLIKEENNRLKQAVLRLEESDAKQRLKIDVLEVENLKMQETLKIKTTLGDSLRKENDWMTKTMALPQAATTYAATVRPLNESLTKSRQSSFTPLKKLTIRQYLEPTLEGDTYYQELSRQFKVHFRRACFKRKQLLFKQSNIELGVITEKKAIDQVNCTLFITNHGARDLQQLRIKILNPVANDITCDASYFQILLQGEQQKIYIDARVLSYPIGPFILKLSYVEEDRDVGIQLLVPITLIKLVSYQNRSTGIASPQRQLIRYDRKVVNSPESLSTFFPGVDFSTDSNGNQRAKMSVEHQHSQTTFDLDLSKEGDNIELTYGMQSGREEIMRYYIRILASLLEK